MIFSSCCAAGTVEANRVGNTAVPINTASRFSLEREILTFRFPMEAQIVEFQPPRKMVCTCDSEAHTATEQFILMQASDLHFCMRLVQCFFFFASASYVRIMLQLSAM